MQNDYNKKKCPEPFNTLTQANDIQYLYGKTFSPTAEQGTLC
jgi:hypothetical protein